MKKQFITSDSGSRQEFSTGAVRDIQTGKGRYDLVPSVPLHRLAKVYERGAAKYGASNWRKGIPFSRMLDSATRHLNEYKMICEFQREGIALDQLPPEVNPNEDHLAQAVWNLIGIMHFETFKPELDDLTKNGDSIHQSSPEVSAA